jgi:hypothetical protein
MKQEEREKLEKDFKNAELAMIVYQIKENERWDSARNVFEAWKEYKKWQPERLKVVRLYVELKELYEQHRGKR